MKWIYPGDIKNWITSKQKHCQETLPELVRRLILAHTGGNVEELSFRIKDSTGTRGWDGILKTAVKSTFFPEGSSGWEISAENETSIKSKADSDYEKRTKDPLGLTPANSTFVFLTPQIFSNPKKWQEDKISEGKWKDIRVIDGDGLELWLGITPATALWLAKQIKDGISGNIRDIEAIWEWWSLGTVPPLTSDIVLAGRIQEVEQIRTWLAGYADVLEVQGDHPDEAYAFLYSSIANLSTTERSYAFSRCIVVDNVDDFKNCVEAFRAPLIIAAPSSCSEFARVATKRGHHIFIAMDSLSAGRRNFLRLSRPKRFEVQKALQGSGFSDDDSQKIARDAGRSIPVLRRHLLLRSGTIINPPWADPEPAKLLIPVLFVASWADNKAGDRNVIEAMSGKNFDVFDKELSSLLAVDDPPIMKVGNIWMLKSPLEAWFLLSRYIDNNFLELYKQTTIAVLTETDPKYELPPDDRWASAMFNKTSNYSEWIRKGLVDSLVLLVVYGDQPEHTFPFESFVKNIVKDILTSAATWQIWASLKDVTPRLAEASPEAFLDVIEKVSEENATIFRELLRDDGNTIFSECRHSGLLWALESLAWIPEYFTRAVRLLAKLGTIDPGGHWANRPSASLSDIFLPGFPQTNVTAEARLNLLDILIKENAQLVWQFSQAYFIKGTFSESFHFRWRDRGGERSSFDPESNEEHGKYIHGIFERLANLACKKENLISSTANFIQFNKGIQDKIIMELMANDTSIFSKEENIQLVKNIREELNWINNYGENEIRNYVADLNEILNKYALDDVIERVGWLLRTPWPRLVEAEPRDFNKREQSIIEAQKAAARELLNKLTLKSVLEFGRSVEYPGIFGRALSYAIRDDDEDAKILDELLQDSEGNRIVLMGYAAARVNIIGIDWVDNQIQRIKSKGNYTSESCALLCLGLPESRETWAKVAAFGPEVDQIYWTFAMGQLPAASSKDTEIAIEKLINAKRPERALQIAGQPNISVASSLLKSLILDYLEFASKDREMEDAGITALYLAHIFNQIYERNELPIVEIAQLEWPFASLFDEFKQYISEPLAIHRLLQKDPSFFAQLISYLYKNEDIGAEPSLEKIDKDRLKNLARSASNTLNSWYLLPGLKDDGAIDENELISWVEAAREACAKNRRIIGGDLKIAKMLSCAPPDPDGIWPHAAVRNVIERLANQIIEEHIEIELYNSRGATTRILGTGGGPERELSAKYQKMGDALKVSWPRTAQILRSLARTYEHEARQQDISADLHDFE